MGIAFSILIQVSGQEFEAIRIVVRTLIDIALSNRGGNQRVELVWYSTRLVVAYEPNRIL